MSSWSTSTFTCAVCRVEAVDYMTWEAACAALLQRQSCDVLQAGPTTNSCKSMQQSCYNFWKVTSKIEMFPTFGTHSESICIYFSRLLSHQ